MRDLDPTNELTFVRIASRWAKSIYLLVIYRVSKKKIFDTAILVRKHEVLVAPDTDYILIVLQRARRAGQETD